MGITKRIQINHPKGLKLEKCGLVLALLPPTDKQAHIVIVADAVIDTLELYNFQNKLAFDIPAKADSTKHP